uniref:Innexin n=1 Tax=Loa loa TaxID=7209 RepID=A0A1I7VN16_LOALO
MFETPLLGKLFSTSSHIYHLGDIVDCLHWNVSVAVFILCALFVGAKQQFGQPIQCMLPTHLDKLPWIDYGQYYCFIQNTYRLTYNKTLPSASSGAENRSDAAVNYCQWVPFFLTIQALCFYIPGWLWRTLQGQRTLDMEAAIREAISLKKTFEFEDRVKKLINLIDYIASGLKMKKNMCMFRTVGFLSF